MRRTRKRTGFLICAAYWLIAGLLLASGHISGGLLFIALGLVFAGLLAI